jgi:hypothetical protein
MSSFKYAVLLVLLLSACSARTVQTVTPAPRTNYIVPLVTKLKVCYYGLVYLENTVGSPWLPVPYIRVEMEILPPLGTIGVLPQKLVKLYRTSSHVVPDKIWLEVAMSDRRLYNDHWTCGEVTAEGSDHPAWGTTDLIKN